MYPVIGCQITSMTYQIPSAFTKDRRDVSLQVVVTNGSTPSAWAQPSAFYRQTNRRLATQAEVGTEYIAMRGESLFFFSETLPRFTTF